MDAPLDQITDPKFDFTNSYYASAPLRTVVRGLWGGKFNKKQRATIENQIAAAEEKGLKSRYWGSIRPKKWLYYSWNFLVRSEVGMLNADDVFTAALWLNWGRCVLNSTSTEVC